jgi:toxoflavin biosynthesis protein ToxC
MISASSMYHRAPISGVAASAGYVVTAGYDNATIVWDAETHKALGRAQHDHLVNQCDISPDGKRLVTASSDYSARIYTLPGLRLQAIITCHQDDVLQAKFSPNGKLIATCAYDGTVAISQVTGELVAMCRGHAALVERVAWNADGTTLVSCGTDGTIRGWDATTGDSRFVRSGFSTDIDDVLHLGGDFWIAGGDDGRLHYISPDSERSIPAHGAGIKSLSRSGNRLLTTGYDQRYNIFSIGADLALTKDAGGQLPVEAWARSACLLDDNRIILASFGSHYLIHDLRTGTWDKRDYTPSPGLNGIVARDGRVYTTGDSGALRIDGTVVATVPSLCNAVAVAGNQVLVAGQTGELFDGLSGVVLYAHSAPINRIEVVSIRLDGFVDVALGAYDGAVILLTLLAGKVTSTHIVPVAPSAIKGLCGSEGRIYCGSAGGLLTVLDAATGEILRSTANAHSSILNDVSLFTGGFATVSRDLTLRWWTREGAPAGVIRTRHEKSVKCVATSDDQRYCATGSYGGTIDIIEQATTHWVGALRRPTIAGISSITWCTARGSFLAASYDGYVYEVFPHED